MANLDLMSRSLNEGQVSAPKWLRKVSAAPRGPFLDQGTFRRYGLDASVPNALRNQKFQPFVFDKFVTSSGEYPLKLLELGREFPLSVKLYEFTPLSHCRLNWHATVEIILPVEGEGLFCVGDQTVEFAEGDIIAVDNLKVHGWVEFRGRCRRAIIITFLPSLVCSPGAMPYDFVFLTPFYCRAEGLAPVLRPSDALWYPAYKALGDLGTAYFSSPKTELSRAESWLCLLQLLAHLVRRLSPLPEASPEYRFRKQQSERLGRLLDYVSQEYGEKITIGQAASLVGMSESAFMQFFKRATGTSFISYVTQVRLAHAHRLLVESTHSIAEIAYMTGFSDQSYFARRFKQHYRRSPRSLRT